MHPNIPMFGSEAGSRKFLSDGEEVIRDKLHLSNLKTHQCKRKRLSFGRVFSNTKLGYKIKHKSTVAFIL